MRKSASPKVRRARKSRSKSRSPKRVKSIPLKVLRVRKSKKTSAKRTSRKKVNKWVSFIKSEAKRHNMTFKQALMDPKLKALYKNKS